MQHILALPERAVKRDCGLIIEVGLHKEGPCTALGRDLPKMPDQRGGNPLPAKRLGNCQIINVEFAARLLEFPQFVGDKAANIFSSPFMARSTTLCGSASQFAR
jgi:hypothetical protein